MRRFRTSPDRRSTKRRQLVIQPNLLSIREVAIGLNKRRPARRTEPAWMRPLQTFAPLLLTILGISGALSFAPNIKQSARLDLINPHPAVAHAQTPNPSSVSSKLLPKSVPVRLQIPKINLDTSLLSTGLNPDGTIAMPNVFDAAAWYDKSPTPGEVGPSVIVGHVDRVGGIAVFWRLRELVTGDSFSVLRADGTTANFKIVDVEQFEQDQFPTQAVYGPINYAGIRLITCGGTFNTATGHYDHNTVIYGRLD